METRSRTDTQATSLGDMQLRQIVEMYPASMRVLDTYGMDMCCGGAHTLAEASRLHGLDPDCVIAEVQDTIQHGQT
jgi:iron-sulfur cluster repair protein YtfE (RIC family)